jgi:hypothetical protein
MSFMLFSGRGNNLPVKTEYTKFFEESVSVASFKGELLCSRGLETASGMNFL